MKKSITVFLALLIIGCTAGSTQQAQAQGIDPVSLIQSLVPDISPTPSPEPSTTNTPDNTTPAAQTEAPNIKTPQATTTPATKDKETKKEATVTKKTVAPSTKTTSKATTTATTTKAATTKQVATTTPVVGSTQSTNTPRAALSTATLLAATDYYTPLDDLSPESTYALSFIAMLIGIGGAILILREPRQSPVWISGLQTQKSLLE